MKKIALLFLMSVSLWLALISVASAEVIRSFRADIVVETDSSLLVTETITYDFEGVSRHGIYRNINEQHAQPSSAWYKQRYIDLELLSVQRDSASEPFQIQNFDGLSVRIGDADRTITGLHTYTIKYRVLGALASYDDGTTELYWNVTGDEWQVPMEYVTATVAAKGGAQLLSDQSCYRGVRGVGNNCEVVVREGSVHFVAENIVPGEQVTVAQAVTLPQPPVMLERYDTILLWLLALVAWFSIFGVWLYRWRTTHRIERAVVAQYEPYEGFKPMFTGVLFDNRLDSKDLTASIIYLAQQGFLKINQTTDKVLGIFKTTDYEITLLRNAKEAETQLQKEVLRMLIGYEAAAGTTVRLSEITKSSSKSRANFKLFQKMKKAAVDDLIARGFLQQRISRGVKGTALAIGFYLSFFIFEPVFALFTADLIVGFFALVVSLALFFLVGAERRTRRGYEALNHLKGFKDFLATSEKERYKFHNAPSKSPDQFMEYLPYAIAFGVEEEWAEVFKDIAIDAPSWYSSPSGSHFNATVFAADIGTFATAFASSGASSSSGSSGGGFSGGGSGGGGGGSW